MTDKLQTKQKLTKKQEMFCREYVSNGHNGEKAAVFAGYSKKTAKSTASENLTKPNLNELIDELELPVLKKLGLDENWVLTKLKNFSDALVIDFFDLDKDKNIVLKKFDKIPKEKWEAVESIEQNDKRVKIKLFNKPASVVNIGKNYGMFKELIEGNIQHDHTHKVYVIPSFNSDNVTDGSKSSSDK